MRERLPKKHRHLTVDNLRHLIVNRRKQGAYARKPRSFPSWYVEYRQGDHWKSVEEKALGLLQGCSINPEHAEGVVLYHRCFVDRDGVSVLGRESPEDLLALCPQCFRRNWKFLPQVPDEPLE